MVELYNGFRRESVLFFEVYCRSSQRFVLSVLYLYEYIYLAKRRHLLLLFACFQKELNLYGQIPDR